MGRRRFPRLVPPPVTSTRVPDVVRDKCVRLSRAEKRALREKQLSFLSAEEYAEQTGRSR
jgi:hypothetical protein